MADERTDTQADRTSTWKGWWILGVFLVIYMFTGTGFLYDIAALDLHSDVAPGEDSVFYFLRRDFVHGLSFGTGMLLTLVLAILTWTHNRRYSATALWMAWIWCMPGCANAVLIYFKSTNLMKAGKATSDWATFEAYHDDPIRWIVFGGTMLIGIALARLLHRGDKARRLTEET